MKIPSDRQFQEIIRAYVMFNEGIKHGDLNEDTLAGIKEIYINNEIEAEKNERTEDKFTGWSPAVNCQHDCATCQAKCLFRKQPYDDLKVR